MRGATAASHPPGDRPTFVLDLERAEDPELHRLPLTLCRGPAEVTCAQRFYHALGPVSIPFRCISAACGACARSPHWTYLLPVGCHDRAHGAESGRARERAHPAIRRLRQSPSPSSSELTMAGSAGETRVSAQRPALGSRSSWPAASLSPGQAIEASTTRYLAVRASSASRSAPRNAQAWRTAGLTPV